jgi:LysM repeat protein
MRGVFATMTRSMDESVRKPLTFIAVVCIALALSLGWYRVKAYETFLPDFSNGKELGHVEQKAAAQELIYKVQSGDAWWKIARDHNVSTRALLEANGANVGTELVPGQNIHLPGAPSLASSSPSPPSTTF